MAQSNTFYCRELFFIISAYLFIVSFELQASTQKHTLTIATDTWQNYTEKNGSGLYFELLKKIYEPRGIKLKIKHMPYARTAVTLLNGEADMTLGNYKGSFKKEWYSNCPAVQDNVDIALPKKEYENWQGPQSLKGKRVVSSFGMGFNKYYTLDEVIYSEVRNHELMVKMLISGRTDAILNYRNDIKASYKLLGRDDFHIIEGVFTQPSYFVFYDSEKALHYKAIFDEAIKKMINSGEYRKLVMKHLNDESYYPDFSLYTGCLN